MSRFQLRLIAMLAPVLLAGCASSQMSRIDRNREIYETWPIEVRQAVLDGKVEAGMTPEMVRVAWGQPTEVLAQPSGDEVWVYKKGGDDGMIYPGSYPPGTYPGGTYPGGTYPSGINSGTGISIGSGGTSVGTSVGTGIGIGGGGVLGSNTGMGAPIMTRPTPPEIREVVFRNGVVQRADSP